jgi:hypothetical protein
MGTRKFGGKYGSICGQIWVPDHESQFAPLRAEISLLETVGGCPNPLLSKDLNNSSPSKTKIRNWTKNKFVTGKTHNGQRNVRTVFQVYIHKLHISLYHPISHCIIHKVNPMKYVPYICTYPIESRITRLFTTPMKRLLWYSRCIELVNGSYKGKKQTYVSHDIYIYIHISH